jgi:hypothetical protein
MQINRIVTRFSNERLANVLGTATARQVELIENIAENYDIDKEHTQEHFPRLRPYQAVRSTRTI